MNFVLEKLFLWEEKKCFTCFLKLFLMEIKKKYELNFLRVTGISSLSMLKW